MAKKAKAAMRPSPLRLTYRLHDGATVFTERTVTFE
jgi:hypothetical protein